MPFKWSITKEKELYQAHIEMTKGMKTFELAFQNFGVFQPRVISVDVEVSKFLRALRDQVLVEI